MSPEGFISICKQEHVTIFAKSTNSGKHKNFIISNNKNVYDFYSGKGKWSSTPIVFSSLDNALRSLPRATGVLLAKDFISAGIVAQNKTKQGEYIKRKEKRSTRKEKEEEKMKTFSQCSKHSKHVALFWKYRRTYVVQKALSFALSS
mgnify:CR=1 FL=1